MRGADDTAATVRQSTATPALAASSSARAVSPVVALPSDRITSVGGRGAFSSSMARRIASARFVACGMSPAKGGVRAALRRRLGATCRVGSTGKVDHMQLGCRVHAPELQSRFPPAPVAVRRVECWLSGQPARRRPPCHDPRARGGRVPRGRAGPAPPVPAAARCQPVQHVLSCGDARTRPIVAQPSPRERQCIPRQQDGCKQCERQRERHALAVRRGG